MFEFVKCLLGHKWWLLLANVFCVFQRFILKCVSEPNKKLEAHMLAFMEDHQIFVSVLIQFTYTLLFP